MSDPSGKGAGQGWSLILAVGVKHRQARGYADSVRDFQKRSASRRLGVEEDRQRSAVGPTFATWRSSEVRVFDTLSTLILRSSAGIL